MVERSVSGVRLTWLGQARFFIGRDFFREERGIVGNLNAREAVELASRVGARILVPMHWDLFAGNTEQPSVVLDEVVRTGARLHVLTLDRLRSFELL